MGVAGLHSWAEAQAGLGTRIRLQAKDGGETIILDAGAGMMSFFAGQRSLVGDFAALRKSVEKLVQRFRRAGFRLVVVVDGAVPAEKHSTWLSRRRKDAKRVEALNAAMAGGPVKASGKQPFLWLPPAFCQTYVGSAFRAAGCQVVFSTVEADRVCAGLAASLGAFGVLGRDSDFFAFALGRALYLDFSTLQGLSVVAYSQPLVLERLGLPLEALPLLSDALGNDLHSRKRALHEKIMAGEGEAVPLAVAAVCKRLTEPEPLVPRTDRERDVFEWYTPVIPSLAPARAVLRPHLEVLLAARTFVGPLTFEHLVPAQADAPTVFEATAALRAAVYARLFGCNPGDSSVVTELLCSARRDTSWPTTQNDFSNSAPAAFPAAVVAASPGEAPAQAVARHVVSHWLAPHLAPHHADALVAQADPARRVAFHARAPPPLGLRGVRPADVHAMSLFLVAMDMFLWQADAGALDLPIWDHFDGLLYHALLQQPARAGAELAAVQPLRAKAAGRVVPKRDYVSRGTKAPAHARLRCRPIAQVALARCLTF